VDASISAADPAAAVLAQQSFARFLEALRHITRFMTGPLMENPLDAAVQRIEANPAFAQHRLLTRLLAALPGQQGMFRTEEASVFDRDTLAVIVSLMHAHDTGASPPADWQRAINRVETAQMAHG
jgi:thioesterase domain-containing protein